MRVKSEIVKDKEKYLLKNSMLIILEVDGTNFI